MSVEKKGAVPSSPSIIYPKRPTSTSAVAWHRTGALRFCPPTNPSFSPWPRSHAARSAPSRSWNAACPEPVRVGRQCLRQWQPRRRFPGRLYQQRPAGPQKARLDGAVPGKRRARLSVDAQPQRIGLCRPYVERQSRAAQCWNNRRRRTARVQVLAQIPIRLHH